MSNLKQITVRIDGDDLKNLKNEAQKLQIQPGTLIRMLLHSILTWNRTNQESVDVFGNLQQALKAQGQEK
jgi:hypothetical protein